MVRLFSSKITGAILMASLVGCLASPAQSPVQSLAQSPAQNQQGPSDSALSSNNLIDADSLSLEVLTEAMSEATKSVSQATPSSSGQQGTIQNVWSRLKSAAQAILPERVTRLFQNFDNTYDIKNQYEQFKKFMKTYGRVYNPAELSTRFSVFMTRMSMIKESVKEFSEGKSTYVLEMNNFADKNQDELDMMAGKKQALPGAEEEQNDIDTDDDFSHLQKKAYTVAPSSKDWRQSGCLGKVLNQRQCGSCYIFSTLQTIAAQVCLKNRTQLELAPQQPVDCMRSGCDGGLEKNVVDHYNARGKMSLERCYPYTGRDAGYCQIYYKTENRPGCAVGASIDGTGGKLKMKRITGHNNIVNALGTIGPLAGGLYVPNDLYSYSRGIFEGRTCYRGRYQNHAVLLAGYGEENGKKYWLMKNSWGPDWGENGYFRVKRGNNECKVEQEAFIIYNQPTRDYDI